MSLTSTSHRPWPLPAGPWIGRQSWCDLLFAHWPVSAESLRSLVPPELEIQEFGGTSWVGLVPFRMTGVMLRGLPDLPYISAFPELNVRLYVEKDGRPGVWFLSLDAANRFAVWGARKFLHLPYFHAAMSLETNATAAHKLDDNAAISYRSARTTGNARFTASYGPEGEVYRAQPGSLEHWLTERYCLYAQAPSGTLRRMEVHHAPWPLQRASAEIEENTIFAADGLNIAGPPALLHFSRRLDVVVWSPEKLSETSFLGL